MTWQEHASCVQRPDLPWATDTHHLPDKVVSSMRAVCAGCPVLTECGTATTELRITGGFWAGVDRNISRTAALPPEIIETPTGQFALDIRV